MCAALSLLYLEEWFRANEIGFSASIGELISYFISFNYYVPWYPCFTFIMYGIYCIVYIVLGSLQNKNKIAINMFFTDKKSRNMKKQ
jgi:hypothetical protein